MRPILFVIFFLSARLALCEYHVFYENGKAGLRDESGKVILPASFEALGWTDGSFSVINQVTGYRKQSQWGLINLKKELVTKAEFESLTSAGGDRVIASRLINPYTKKFGCLDLNGTITVPFYYDGITILGLRAIVFLKNGTRYEYGLIDLNNKSVLPMRYREITPVGTLRFAIQNFEKKTALFTEEGIRLTDFVIDSISEFRKGKAIIYQQFQQGLIDREGSIRIEPVYREIRIDDQGAVTARAGDEWIILNHENVEIKKINADDLVPVGSFYAVRRANKHGLLDRNLDEVIPTAYDFLGPMQNHQAVARRAGKYGVVRERGPDLFPFGHDSLVLRDNFIRAANRVMGQWQWTVYDTFAVQKTNRSYDQIRPFNGKFFSVQNRGYWGAVDRYGVEIIPCAYDSLLDFNKELVVVKFKGQYGIVDMAEKWKVLPQPHPLRLVAEQLYFEQADSITFLRNTDKEIIYFTSNPVHVRGDHLEEVLPNGVVKLVSFRGMSYPISAAPVVDHTERVFEEHEGMRGILRNGKYGFIDVKGRLRVANRYEDVGIFSEGMAPAMILGKWGYVNKEDKILINPNFTNAGDFHDQLAIVTRDKTGVIDAHGKIILPLRYDSITRVQNNFLLYSGKKYGIADRKGHVLIEPRFDFLQVLPNDLVIATNDHVSGVLTLEGLPVIPMVYYGVAFNPATSQFLVNRKSVWTKVEMN